MLLAEKAVEPLLPKFPEPRVPKNPVLGWASFSGADDAGRVSPIPTLLDFPHRKFVTSARVAIALALKRLGVGPGDTVLVPGYHCLSMVEPVVFTGATPLFFPLTEHLEVPVSTLSNVDLSHVRALLVTHYFGFPQAMRVISAFAKERGIPIIEDCAHAIFGSSDGQPIGSWGDYAAASLMKFFPVYDGGCLASQHHSLDGLKLRPPSRRFEVKALINAIERGLFYERFPGMQTAARTAIYMKDAMWAGYKHVRGGRGAPAHSYHDPAASDGVNGLDPSWIDRRISIASMQLVERLPVARIVARRRRNYTRLASELTDLPGARALFPHLPDDVVPYVFPLLVDRPERVFRRLKEDAVPLFRWEHLWDDEVTSIDPRSARYATEIFQLPCHQDLTDADVAWIIDRVRAAFRAA